MILIVFVEEPNAQIFDANGTVPRNVSEFEAAQTLSVFNSSPGFSSVRLFGEFSGEDDSIIDQGIRLQRVRLSRELASDGNADLFLHGTLGQTKVDFIAPLSGTTQYREDDYALSA